MAENARWRKVGGGSLRLKSGRIIKPNQVFTAALEDIPAGVDDLLVPVNEEATEVKEHVKTGQTPLQPEYLDGLYEIRARGVGWFDIVNTESGKVVNDKALRSADAAALVEKLKDGDIRA